MKDWKLKLWNLKLQYSKFETSTFDDLVFGATGATEASGEDVVALIVVRYSYKFYPQCDLCDYSWQTKHTLSYMLKEVT